MGGVWANMGVVLINISPPEHRISIIQLVSIRVRMHKLHYEALFNFIDSTFI